MRFACWAQLLVELHNATRTSLLPACLAAFPHTPHYCFMPPHMQRFIQTPFFMFNGKYDAWQARRSTSSARARLCAASAGC